MSSGRLLSVTVALVLQQEGPRVREPVLLRWFSRARPQHRAHDLPWGLPHTAGGRASLARTSSLNRWTRHRAIGTEHAAIPLLRAQRRATATACVEDLAGVGRHGFRLRGGAVQAGDDGLKDHGFSCISL